MSQNEGVRRCGERRVRKVRYWPIGQPVGQRVALVQYTCQPFTNNAKY